MLNKYFIFEIYISIQNKIKEKNFTPYIITIDLILIFSIYNKED